MDLRTVITFIDELFYKLLNYVSKLLYLNLFDENMKKIINTNIKCP